jgi:serine/threonine protein kinase
VQVGQEIDGKYILEKPLGDGAMGLVWQARKKDTMTRVALKFVSNTFNSPKVRVLFEREIQSLKTLNHPNIPRFVDENTLFDPPYFAMEYVDGDAYSELIEQGTLKRIPLQELVSNIFDLASALSHAHAQGLIHRDIKPGNIKGSLNKPYLLDFGIALTLESADQTEVLRGTIAYMPPEGEASHDGDLFSFGVVAYEMLFGVRPILYKEDNATNPLQALKLVNSRLFKEDWRLPSTLVDDDRHPELRGKDLIELDDVFRRVFTPDPQQRHEYFPEVLDFANALGQALMPFNVQRNFNPFSSTTPMFGLVKRKTDENKVVVPSPQPDDSSALVNGTSTLDLSPIPSKFSTTPTQRPKIEWVGVAGVVFLVVGFGVLGVLLSRLNETLPSPPLTQVAQIRSSEATTEAPLPSKTLAPTRTGTEGVGLIGIIPSSTAMPTTLASSATNTGVLAPTTTRPVSSATPTVAITNTPIVINTTTYTPSPTRIPSVTPSRTPNPTATMTPTRTASPTATMTPTLTPSATPSPTLTPSVTPSSTLTPTVTPRPTLTATITASYTPTPVPTLTPIPLSATPMVLGDGQTIYTSVLITNRAYRACNAQAPQECPPPSIGADSMTNAARQSNPVVGITWKNALNYCLLQGGRLLSEGEWQTLAESGQIDLSGQTIGGEWLISNASIANTVWELDAVKVVLANTQMPIGKLDGTTTLQSVARANESVGFRCAFRTS